MGETVAGGQVSHYILWAIGSGQYQALGSFLDREGLGRLRKSLSMIPNSVIPNAVHKIMAVKSDGTNEIVEENAVTENLEMSMYGQLSSRTERSNAG